VLRIYAKRNYNVSARGPEQQVNSNAGTASWRVL